jgi:glycosyltransferase involved in cell wall biosynthesis
MKILVLHNFYRDPGGEDQVFRSEVELLSAHGHDVRTYTRSNDELAGRSAFAQARMAIWNSETYRHVRSLVEDEGIDVVHCHNSFPLMSPSVYWAAAAAGAAVVTTVHNYRFTCVNGLLFRDGSVCEQCVGRAVPVHGVLHGCYRGSAAASAVAGAMLSGHRLVRTWHRAVHRIIALTEFQRQIMLRSGLPEAKIVLKSNFLEFDPGVGEGRGGYALFLGRFTEGKGLKTLLDAWSGTGSALPLKIVGDGPQVGMVTEAAQETSGIEWLGPLPFHVALDILGSASLLVVPSESYEGMPRTIIESFARGTPVVAARRGAMASMVTPGENGEHFEPGSAAGLRSAVTNLVAEPGRLRLLRKGARRTFEVLYGADANYSVLMRIYREAVRIAGGSTEGAC